MPLSRHPRKFVLHVDNINIDVSRPTDCVEIVFAGKVLPSTRERIVTQLKEGNFTVVEKRLA